MQGLNQHPAHRQAIHPFDTAASTYFVFSIPPSAMAKPLAACPPRSEGRPFTQRSPPANPKIHATITCPNFYPHTNDASPLPNFMLETNIVHPPYDPCTDVGQPHPRSLPAWLKIDQSVTRVTLRRHAVSTLQLKSQCLAFPLILY